jgi:hypothetical protein
LDQAIAWFFGENENCANGRPLFVYMFCIFVCRHWFESTVGFLKVSVEFSDSFFHVWVPLLGTHDFPLKIGGTIERQSKVRCDL